MKRSVQYIEEKNPEFFESEAIKKLEHVIFKVTYSPFIDTNYLKVLHKHGSIWYSFNEKTFELKYFAGNYVNEKFVRDNPRVE